MNRERRDEIASSLRLYRPSERRIKAEPFTSYTRRLGDEWAAGLLPKLDPRAVERANDTLTFLRGRLRNG